MNEKTSKSREQAELAFSKTQTQFLARNRTAVELDTATAARNEKTNRLRELRLGKAAEDSATAIPAEPKDKEQA
jgi:hypothetical protein